MTTAIAQPRIDLEATAAWNGWTRPGRVTEVDVRVSSDIATRATLDVAAGRQVVRANLDLEPGRVVRLQVPIESAEGVAVSAVSPAAPPQRRDVRIAQSESPVLGLGLVTGDPVQLDGFHTVALDGDNLPRNALAYSSIDALILDESTLGALDQRQLRALLVHAAECGRIVLLNADLPVRRVLDGSAGCGGRALMHATSLADAIDMLKSSLAANRVVSTALPGISELGSPDLVTWNRVLIVVAAYFAAAILAALFFSSLPVLLLAPTLATVAILALLHAAPPSSQLVVWSEATSGAESARYQAWQRFPGLARGGMRVPVLQQLASARSCDPNQPMRFDFDAGHGQATFAEFDTRLFRQVMLCYSGSFPVARALAIEARRDGMLQVRNSGSIGWPGGVLLAGGLVHELQALGPGDDVIVDTRSGKPFRNALMRTALARTRTDGAAALWELELGGVTDIPPQSKAWLLVSIPPP
jgi:hypothetical protein